MNRADNSSRLRAALAEASEASPARPASLASRPRSLPITIKWVRSKVSIKSGEYAAAQTEVVQHASADGRFTILPRGGMSYAKDQGIRGHLNKKWRWTGYRITDSLTGRTDRSNTVQSLKRWAERRLASEPHQ